MIDCENCSCKIFLFHNNILPQVAMLVKYVSFFEGFNHVKASVY
jgi:hypothetical protein